MSLQQGSTARARAGGSLAVASASALFGTTAVATLLLAPELPAVTTAGWRVVVGGLVLVAISVLFGRAPWHYRMRWRPVIVGGLAFVAFQLGFFAAVGRVGAATATIIAIGVSPIAAGAIDRVQRGIRLRRSWWVGIVVAVAGIAVLSGADGVLPDPLGWASAVMSGCFFAVFGAAIRDLMSDRPALTAIATVFGAAILPAAVMLAVAGTNPFVDPGSTAAVLWVGVVTTGVAYGLWVRGLAVLSLGDTVTLTMLEPVAATLLAIVILREAAGLHTVVGIVAVLIGVWLATTRPGADQPTSSAAQGGLAPAREQVMAETLEANVNAAVRPSSVNVSRRPPR